MTRAMTTVVSKVHTSVITTSKPMKTKLRPTTFALLSLGAGMVSVVKLISGLGRVVKMPAGFQDKRIQKFGIARNRPEPDCPAEGRSDLEPSLGLAAGAPVKCGSCESFCEARSRSSGSTR